MSGTRGSMFLSTDWTVTDVRRCLGKKDGEGLIEFLRQRHQERFFKPIQLLGKAKMNWQGHGFAMMSLCSLLIETIQSYRDGLPSTNLGELHRLTKKIKKLPVEYTLPAGLTFKDVNSGKAFNKFFRRFRKEFDGLTGKKFYNNIRNGLLHQAQTKRGWTIRMDGANLHEAKVINRDIFADRLEQAFESYLAELRSASPDSVLWKNARRKVWWLIRLS